MDQPVTEAPGLATPTGEAPGRPDEGEWLVDPTSPVLTEEVLVRFQDDRRPDRLAWNTMRTLALWDADAWVPRLLEVACGHGNRLAALEWGGASVVPWPAPLDAPDVSDFVLDGPEAYVLLASTLVSDPSEEQLRAAAMASLDGSLHAVRDAGLVVVAPPGSDGLPARIEMACDFELHDGRRLSELMTGATGWISWPELGRLALDLAEEGDPDVAPTAQVRRLVAELQARFPDANL